MLRFPCLQFINLNVVKVPILHRVIYRLNAISTKTSMPFRIELDCGITKLTWEHRRLQLAQTILIKTNRVGGLCNTWFQGLAQSHNDKSSPTVAWRQVHRPTTWQEEQTEKYIHNRAANRVHLQSINISARLPNAHTTQRAHGLKNGTGHQVKLNLGSHPSPYRKTNPKWAKELNIRWKPWSS